ncbi:hypothetical protein M2132_002461 [Dysgonomonas sp. PH5-45]|uniref:OmpP1/FadL family transporter n=1 Tax=unclassified Dysgonomonas TaxID=2630389 RepID=UPI002475A11A|nr:MULTISPECIES: outer membrane protein transport protein [unclassified Dysgonomonas]MDH6356098.1 hypothetical protein [Dysgonomonas sp. PH5-45]MDH6388992.1 hypothetical protein [Dysgonomonas sp. PH5-37]
MKRFFITVLALSSALGSAFAQGELDAYKLSQTDLQGTARSVGMGGAFGALGGDVSGVAINPAGIGIYTTSEVVATFGFTNTQSKANLNIGSLSNDKFKFTCDNFAYVGTFPINSYDMPSINFGVSINRLKSFDRKYNMKGAGLNWSMTDYMANRANYGYDPSLDPDELKTTNNFPFEALGYQAYLMDYSNGQWQSVADRMGLKVDNDLLVHEKGSIYSYDFNFGTTISNIVSVGLGISVTDINYKMSSSYIEDFGSNNFFDLMNWLKTEGSGFQAKVGVIVKPINELRIGLAYHSPTWYEMTDYYGTELYHQIPNLASDADYRPGTVSTYHDNDGNASYLDYDLRSPDKWVFSLAGVIGKYAIISADYELTNYGNMKLDTPDGGYNYYQASNKYISEDFRTSSTLRVGAEVRFTPQFSGRVGYSWVQSPFKSHTKADNYSLETAGTVVHYTVDGDTNYFTYGLGYKFSPNFYIDVAFILKNQKSDLRAYYEADRASLKTNTTSGILTLGYKF